MSAGEQELPRFDGEAALQLIARQLEFGPRNPGSAGHAACLRWMRDRLDASAHELRIHRVSMDDPYGEGRLELTNLWAAFHPERTRRIALGAHWDTRPRADEQPGGALEEPIPGANDGGSGVAVLLTLAEILAERTPEGFGVDLLFFDGEDYGRAGDLRNYLLGSTRFVAEHPRYRPEALILLDMVAGKDMSIPMEGNGLQLFPDLTLKVFGRAAQLGLPAFDASPGRPVYDDHVPFLQMGIPAVDLIDLDYRHWHTLQDDLQACSAQSLQQVGDLLIALLYLDFSTP
jgi:hypothetical protein